MPRLLRRRTPNWDATKNIYAPKSLRKAYEEGLAGSLYDPAKEERLADAIRAQGSYAHVSASEACHAYGLAELGKGKLTIPFIWSAHLWPRCMPGPAQIGGSCVSHGMKNMARCSYACEVIGRKPDEVTGKIDGDLDISEEGRRNGVFSTEAIYWYRDHNSHGWHCHHAAEVLMKESGLWVRQNYPDLGFDLTKVSNIQMKWGRPNPPAEVTRVGQEHLVRTVTLVDTREACRDLLAAGYGIGTCGGESFSDTRDENGVSSRTRQGWAHSMSEEGFDDRPEIVEKYGGPLVLTGNSWAGWNRGPRDIYKSSHLVPPQFRAYWEAIDLVNPQTGNIMIPHGYFWAKWSDVQRRSRFAASSIAGWPIKPLPDLGFDEWSS